MSEVKNGEPVIGGLEKFLQRIAILAVFASLDVENNQMGDADVRAMARPNRIYCRSGWRKLFQEMSRDKDCSLL